MRKPTLPRLSFPLPLPLARKRTPSVLDMPESEYDPNTHLPERMQVGKYLVKPLVGIQDGECGVQRSAAEGSGVQRSAATQLENHNNVCRIGA